MGGGPSGIMAAQAAAESGMSVILIEGKSFLGGNLTIGLPILNFHGQKGNQIIKGLPAKFVDRLANMGGASAIQRCPLHMSITFIEPEEAKLAAINVMRENNVSVLLNTFCVDTIVEGTDLKGVIIENKGGRSAVLAKVVIDCSGDGDIAFRAGARFEKGNSKGLMQPATLEFCLKNVDIDKLRYSVYTYPETYDTTVIPAEYYRENRYFILVGLQEQMRQAKRDGLELPVDTTVIVTGLGEDEIWVNMTRVLGTDGTDAASVTNAEFEARKQIDHLLKYFRGYVPGFENCYVSRTAPFIGIRETRRIVGKYTLQREDILSRRQFEDGVAVVSYPLDIHQPDGNGFSLEWSGDCYDIPYGSLVPEKINNLLMAGRCISASHEAMASSRVMGPCMAMGEAAGRAAYLAVKHGITPAEVDTRELRGELLDRGAFLRT
ncbi:FAD-dependent oxidoreductase [Parapedobacter soli]|uniref:FAD-dependent oxidoreductase n=1 Tax=Parapedobacter soli TaxID=416955 RepID=UPI0036F2768E